MAIQLTYPEGSALVAGGSGNVGAGITRRMAEAGLPVVFTYVGNEARAEGLADKLRSEGLKVWARKMDMCAPDSIDAAIAFAEDKGGPLRTVSCAAGAFVPFNNLRTAGCRGRPRCPAAPSSSPRSCSRQGRR